MKKKPRRAQRDFTEHDLPATRVEVFRDCYRVHFPLLCKTGALLLLASLPIWLTMFFEDSYVIGMQKQLPDMAAETLSEIRTYSALVLGAIRVASRAIFGFLLAGITQVLRRLTWNEPVFFWDDFKSGISDNGRRFLLGAVLCSLALYTVELLPGRFLSGVVWGMAFFGLFPMTAWWLLQTVDYRLTCRAALRNTGVIYLRTLPVTWLLTLAAILPPVLIEWLIPLVLVKYGLLILWAFFGIVPSLLAWLLAASHYFDEMINEAQYPERLRRGLREEKVSLTDGKRT